MVVLRPQDLNLAKEKQNSCDLDNTQNAQQGLTKKKSPRFILPSQKKKGGKNILRTYNKQRLKVYTELQCPGTDPAERCRMRDQITINADRVRRLSKQLSERERELQATASQFAEKDRTIARQNREIKKLEQKLITLTSQISEEQKSTKSKTNLLAKYAVKMNRARSEAISEAKEVAILQSRLREVEDLLKIKETQASSALINQLQETKTKLRASVQRNQDLEKMAKDWEPRLRTKEEELEQYTIKLKAYEGHNEKMQNQLTASLKMAEMLKKLTEEQKAKLEQLYKSKAEKQELEKAYDQEKQLSKGTIKRLKEDIEAQGKVVKDFQWQLQIVADRVKLRDSDVMKVHKENIALKRMIAKTEGELLKEREMHILTRALVPKRKLLPPREISPKPDTPPYQSIDFNDLKF